MEGVPVERYPEEVFDGVTQDPEPNFNEDFYNSVIATVAWADDS